MTYRIKKKAPDGVDWDGKKMEFNVGIQILQPSPESLTSAKSFIKSADGGVKWYDLADAGISLTFSASKVR